MFYYKQLITLFACYIFLNNTFCLAQTNQSNLNATASSNINHINNNTSISSLSSNIVNTSNSSNNINNTMSNTNNNNVQPKKKYSSPPPMTIDTNKTYIAILETNFGTIEIELFAKDAPKTVNNFVFLAREGFYDNTIFHRIIKDFVIQGGDPEGTGSGGPGYRFEDELPIKRSYEKGIVAMANAGPNTQGSQFFICCGPNAQRLDKYPNYTQFGKVIKGLDVVDAISNVDVEFNAFGELSKPKKPPYIIKVQIIEK